jgi:tetratricopeptide (TPR) repeat protein
MGRALIISGVEKPLVRLSCQPIAMLLSVPVVWTLAMGHLVLAKDTQLVSEENVAERAKGVWESGAPNRALEILNEWTQDNPHTLIVDKLRGDILATSRRPREAVQAYETALAAKPTALDIRWAKWSVLIRWGQREESIAELQRIAQVDAKNPLIHLRLAQELRRQDRLEESLESYKRAVDLVPEMLSWRLGSARARFDVLDYQGAFSELEYVLQRVPPGSPLEIPARNLQSVIIGDTSASERGRRFNPVLTPEGTADQFKEWAAIRAHAWRLFAAGHYEQAEPIYRRVLALNPRDPTAVHQLGLILMELGRCEEALTIFRKMSDLDPGDDDYADTVFRMGQCLVKLERWEDAFVHFQILYDAAVEFEESNKHVALPPGMRVLDKQKLARWLETVRPHVPDLAKPKVDGSGTRLPSGDSPGSAARSDEERFAKIAAERLKPHKPLETRASLMGRDADFSWFRFVIPAGRVMRDDFPTGEHDFIPIHPGDSFPPTQQEIYLVFGLVSSSYDAVPLSAQCFLERAETTGEQRPVVMDHVLTSMSDQSGYFLLSRPAPGWTPGLYRCGLFAGEQTTADTQVDEVRFRIMNPHNS